MTGAARRHEVRLIGGQWKRSKLPVVSLDGLRPTPDRVRVTLFNWLGQDLTGWRCLDAFAGSGALGFEAASRGADEVVLLENNRSAVACLNASRLRLQARGVRIEAADALRWMAACTGERFELVFIDPPFGSTLIPPALDAALGLLVASGFVYVESAEPLAPQSWADKGLRLHKQGRAGAVHVHVRQRVDVS